MYECTDEAWVGGGSRKTEIIKENLKVCQHGNKKTGPPHISFISCHRHSSINEQPTMEWLSVQSRLTPSSLIMSGTSWDTQSTDTSCPPVRHCVVQWQSLYREMKHMLTHTPRIQDDTMSRFIVINIHDEMSHPSKEQIPGCLIRSYTYIISTKVKVQWLAQLARWDIFS